MTPETIERKIHSLKAMGGRGGISYCGDTPDVWQEVPAISDIFSNPKPTQRDADGKVLAVQELYQVVPPEDREGGGRTCFYRKDITPSGLGCDYGEMSQTYCR